LIYLIEIIAATAVSAAGIFLTAAISNFVKSKEKSLNLAIAAGVTWIKENAVFVILISLILGYLYYDHSRKVVVLGPFHARACEVFQVDLSASMRAAKHQIFVAVDSFEFSSTPEFAKSEPGNNALHTLTLTHSFSEAGDKLLVNLMPRLNQRTHDLEEGIWGCETPGIDLGRYNSVKFSIIFAP
jgi:hypothetical protein